jgi:hypothetical protein
MNRKTRIVILSIAVLLLLALPVTVLAAKQIYKADLLGNGSGRGSFVLGTTSPGSWGCLVQAHDLSGDPTAIRILAADGSTLVNVCTGSNCPANGEPYSCTITQFDFAPGVTPQQFLSALQNGQAVGSVATEANPGGEIWGTFFPR